jgi:hypothetical protein
VAAGASAGYDFGMSTLSEIEAVIDSLPPADKQELLLYVAAQLREQSGQLPPPRSFSREQLSAWIAEDEADMQRFRDSHSE